MLRFNGVLSFAPSYIVIKSFIPLAARVLIGPAEIAFTRIFFGPKSAAKYLMLDSSADLATPITL